MAVAGFALERELPVRGLNSETFIIGPSLGGDTPAFLRGMLVWVWCSS